MKTRKTLLIIVTVFCFSAFIFGEDNKLSLDRLLASYLENDLSLQNLVLQKQKAELSKQSSELTNGFDISLSTGTMSFRMDNGSPSFQVRPSAEVSLPQVKNLSVKAGSNISVSSGSGADISDTSLSVGIDIISNSELERKTTMMKTERNVTEAEWKITNTALSAEKSFYNELKALFNSAQNILSEKSNLYTDTISFEETKAKGYSDASSTYRLAQIKVMNSQHSLETKIRSFNHSLAVFYAKCGITLEDSESDSLYEKFISDFEKQIPELEAVKIEELKKSDFSDIETATWNYEINSLQRSGKKNFSLGASAGYTFGSESGTMSKSKVDTADIGVTSTIGGVKLSGGMSIPVTGDSHAPSFTASASFALNTFRQNKITEQTNEISEQQDLISIQEAEKKYDTTIVDKKQSLQDIEWQKQTNDSSLVMYKEIEASMKQYFDNGLIKESEYLSAKTNVDLYTLKQIQNKLELIIYNNEVKSLFR